MSEMKPIVKNDLARFLANLKAKFVQIKDSVRSVNNETPDADGDIKLTRVDFSGDLESSSTQHSDETFLARTTGGEASVAEGNAWLISLKGNAVHTGVVNEVLNMTVNAMEREDPITATLNEETFRAAVDESGTTTLTYTTEWSEDPTTYGVTVTGTPVAGDQIVIVYVKEERGSIAVSNPTSFVSTGWNLFNYNNGNGYARVKKYSDTYGFRIEGAYTSIEFAETFDGVRTSVTVTDGNFSIPSDGYVFVEGGNSSTTAIWMTWEDWTESYPGDFKAYNAYTIDLSSLFGENHPFPYGLLAVGSAQDEINLNVGQAISRVERLEYNAENLATAQNSGREWDADEDYIYLVRASAVTTSISISGEYKASDHGMEIFAGDVAVSAQTIYGVSLKNKLERDVLTMSQQTLTAAQKQQVQENIGILSDLLRLNAYEFSGTLENGKDFNNVGTPGHYLLASNYTYVNAPSSVYFLIVARSTSTSSTIFQIAYGTDVLAFRFRISSTTWSPWRYVMVEAKNGSYSLTGCLANGYVSSTDTKDMFLEVPLFQKIPAGKTISLSSLKMEVRGDQGYVDIFTFANGDIEKKGITGYTYTLTRTASGDLYITLTKSAGLTNVTNNTPVLAKIRSIAFTVS